MLVILVISRQLKYVRDFWNIFKFRNWSLKKNCFVGFLRLQKFCRRFLLLVSVQNVMTCLLIGHISNTRWSHVKGWYTSSNDVILTPRSRPNPLIHLSLSLFPTSFHCDVATPVWTRKTILATPPPKRRQSRQIQWLLRRGGR